MVSLGLHDYQGNKIMQLGLTNKLEDTLGSLLGHPLRIIAASLIIAILLELACPYQILITRKCLNEPVPVEQSVASSSLARTDRGSRPARGVNSFTQYLGSHPFPVTTITITTTDL